MRTRPPTLLLALTAVVCMPPLGAQEPERVVSVCADCHAEVGADEMVALEHAEGVTCLSCHHIGFTNDPRAAEQRRLDACVSCHAELPEAHAHPADSVADCTTCHSVHRAARLPAGAALTERCASCHETDHTLHTGLGADTPSCTACHTLHAPVPFDAGAGGTVPTESCATCHTDVHPSHAEVSGGLTCTDCHRESASPDPAEAVEPATAECATCHAEVLPSHAAAGSRAPGCLDCHRFGDDPPPGEEAAAISARCGACHSDELEAYRSGGHGEGLGARPNADVPACTSCHTAHVDADPTGTRIAATVQCIECHSDESLAERYGMAASVGTTYARDFHGVTVRFQAQHPEGAGGDPVMVCSDCHGSHDVASRDPEAVAGVCLECHEAGDARLAGAWLGHTPPGPRAQPLVWLVRLFYYVMIPFMLGGLFLNIAFHLVDQRRKGARMLRAEGVQRLLTRLRGQRPPARESVVRFSLQERLEHLGSMLTFTLLVITGLPQTYPQLGISHAVIGAFGGIGSTRLIHRTAGFVFVALLVLHVTRAVLRAMRERRLPIMVLRRVDFEDVLQTFRHYLFRAPRPHVGKFDFAQKFEYWGLFLGGVVMSTTGVILVFPELVTQVLPGVLVAVVRVMHGLEATLAVLVIVVWHTYGVILRPEIFPLDTTIFTGRMDVGRLEHEHRLEYERLFPGRVVADHGAGLSEEGAPEPSAGSPPRETV